MPRPIQALPAEEITSRLAQHSGWRYEEGQLTKDYRFADFAGALAFIVRLGLISERLDHHAEIVNLYSRVSLKLSTHTVKGISELDFAWIAALEPTP